MGLYSRNFYLKTKGMKIHKPIKAVLDMLQSLLMLAVHGHRHTPETNVLYVCVCMKIFFFCLN